VVGRMRRRDKERMGRDGFWYFFRIRRGRGEEASNLTHAFSLPIFDWGKRGREGHLSFSFLQ